MLPTREEAMELVRDGLSCNQAMMRWQKYA